MFVDVANIRHVHKLSLNARMFVDYFEGVFGERISCIYGVEIYLLIIGVLDWLKNHVIKS